MKTNVQISSIECFHGRVQGEKEKQHAKIISVMAPGVEYTGQQLYLMTGYTPNIISARMSELREKKEVIRSEERIKCPISHEKVFTHRLKSFAENSSETSPTDTKCGCSFEVEIDQRQTEIAA